MYYFTDPVQAQINCFCRAQVSHLPELKVSAGAELFCQVLGCSFWLLEVSERTGVLCFLASCWMRVTQCLKLCTVIPHRWRGPSKHVGDFLSHLA